MTPSNKGREGGDCKHPLSTELVPNIRALRNNHTEQEMIQCIYCREEVVMKSPKTEKPK